MQGTTLKNPSEEPADVPKLHSAIERGTQNTLGLQENAV